MRRLRRDMKAGIVWACTCALIIVALAASSALGNAVPITGSVDDGKVQYEWDFTHFDLGVGNLAISNIGTQPLNLLELDIAELTQYWSDPDVWQLTPSSGTGIFSISGGQLPNGQSFLIDYEFNKDLVQLVYSDLIYTGIGDDHVHLSNIVTVGLIPEPSTLAVLAIAGPLLLRRCRHRSGKP